MPSTRRETPVDAQARFSDYAGTRDRGVRDELIAQYLPLARRLASRYRGRAVPFDDLVQVASLGLVKAVDRYDPVRGTAFTTFAVPTILGELRRHFRDSGWTLSVPRGLKELRARALRTSERLTVELGRTPTHDELAADMGCELQALLQALDLSSAYRPDSLQRSMIGNGEGATTVVDLLGGADARLDEVDDREQLRWLITELPTRQRQILYLYYYRGLSQDEIGERLNISQVHVSRLLADSRRRMRARAS